MASFPLFILSGPRSGSTLLRYILDTHSAIASPGEIGIGALCNSLAGVIHGTKVEASLCASQEERDAMMIRETREIIDRIMSSYLDLKGKRIWCEKTISNLQHLAILDTIFPDARYICLYRDVLDNIKSSLDCSRQGFMEEVCKYVVQQPRNLLAAMIAAWVENTGMILDFERHHSERCFRIRYEDLVTTPEDSLRLLLSFLGVGWEDDLLTSVFTTRHDQGGGDFKILFSKRIDSSRVGNGQRINLALIPDESKRLAEGLCQELSYPPLKSGRELPWPTPAEREATDDDARIRHIVQVGLKEKLSERADLATALRGSCRLVLQGHGGGSWRLNFTGDVPQVVQDAGPADCSLFMTASTFHDTFAGHLNPVAALWESEITADGNFALARQVGQLLYLITRNESVPRS